MQQKTIPHPTREISFLFDETITWQQQDEEMLNAFLDLHDREQLLEKENNELLHLAAALYKQTAATRTALQKISTQLKNLSAAADKFLIFDLQKDKKARGLSLKAEKTANNLLAFDELLNDLAEETETFSVKKSGFLDMIESQDLLDAFSEAQAAYLKNYTANAIDIVSFNREEEQLRVYAELKRETNNSCFDYADDAVQDYNMLILEVKIEYATWHEFLKRLALINAIAATPEQRFNSSAS